MVIPSVNAQKEEPQDVFTQRDLKIAVILNQLHYYYAAQDEFSAKQKAAGKNRVDDRFDFSDQIGYLEVDIDKLVGCTQIIDQLTVELNQMKKMGLGPKHPHLLWIERLIAGLKAHVNKQAEQAAPSNP
jgi:hypothetical protein